MSNLVVRRPSQTIVSRQPNSIPTRSIRVSSLVSDHRPTPAGQRHQVMYNIHGNNVVNVYHNYGAYTPKVVPRDETAVFLILAFVVVILVISAVLSACSKDTSPAPASGPDPFAKYGGHAYH